MKKAIAKHPAEKKSFKQINKEVLVKDVNDFYKFSSELELNRLLLKNIDLFMGGVFNEAVKYATNKKAERKGCAKICSGQILPLRGVRLDLWVECESGRKYIIEIKNPLKGRHESNRAIGQVLEYSIKFPDATNLVIVSTDYDDGFLEIIKKYNLPIDFVLVTEKSFYLLKKYGKV